VFRRADDAVGGPDFDDRAFVQDGDSIRDGAHGAEIVGNEQRGRGYRRARASVERRRRNSAATVTPRRRRSFLVRRRRRRAGFPASAMAIATRRDRARWRVHGGHDA
jgi:hypothetical protein